MLYQNLTELHSFLQKHQLWNKKSLGQNFLVNLNVLNTIINAAEITKEDDIVEVGPGLGVLTEKLAEIAKKVISIEYDPKLIPILQKNFQKYSNIELINQDALKSSLPTEPYKVVANIPYYITSPLLNHFLHPKTAKEKRPSLIVFLVQKEVAAKICAKEGDHSILSLQVQIFGKPKIIATVGKGNFFPQPKVDSAILKITMDHQPLITDINIFFRLIKSAFAQKRKTLLNSLQNGLKIRKENAATLLEKAAIEPQRRPQTLTIDEWQKLVDVSCLLGLF